MANIQSAASALVRLIGGIVLFAVVAVLAFLTVGAIVTVISDIFDGD